VVAVGRFEVFDCRWEDTDELYGWFVRDTQRFDNGCPHLVTWADVWPLGYGAPVGEGPARYAVFGDPLEALFVADSLRRGTP
jgi:hypothetical protein